MQVAELPHGGPVLCMCEQRRVLLTGGGDGRLRVFDSAALREVSSIDAHDGGVRAMAIQARHGDARHAGIPRAALTPARLPAPSRKTRPLALLPSCARLAVRRQQQQLRVTAFGGALVARGQGTTRGAEQARARATPPRSTLPRTRGGRR